MTTDSKSQTAVLTPKSDTKPVTVKVICPTVDEVIISYGSGAVESAMSATAITTLKEICSRACIKSVTVTSTARTASDQARVMYEALIKPGGVAYSKKLYGANGDKVVAVYEDAVSKKLTATVTKQAMLDKINELGPSNVSHHVVSDDGLICVFDVGPSSIQSDGAKKRFIHETESHSSVAKFLKPPADIAYHIEITN